MIHDLIDRFFSGRLMRFLMRRDKCPAGLEEIKSDGIGYLRFKDWGDFLEYREIWVEPKERQKGWGTIFMQHLAAIARFRGHKEIYVLAHTNGKDDILGKFITANGFVPCQFREFNFKKTI